MQLKNKTKQKKRKNARNKQKDNNNGMEQTNINKTNCDHYMALTVRLPSVPKTQEYKLKGVFHHHQPHFWGNHLSTAHGLKPPVPNSHPTRPNP